MPRVREDCRALPAVGPGVAIREARAAQAIGPRSEADIHTRNRSGIFDPRTFDQFRADIGRTRPHVISWPSQLDELRPAPHSPDWSFTDGALSS